MFPRRAVAAGFLALSIAGGAVAAQSSDDDVNGTATVRFSGSSTLHGFSGTAEPTTFVLERSPSGSWSTVVDVAVAGLSTDNSWRDANMRSMLSADAHPSIRATFALDPDAVRTTGRLTFRLAIAGIEREEIAEISGWEQSSDRVELDTRFTVSLAAFGLKAPATLFMRVDDSVDVEVHVVLTKR